MVIDPARPLFLRRSRHGFALIWNELQGRLRKLYMLRRLVVLVVFCGRFDLFANVRFSVERLSTLAKLQRDWTS
jgi:hypothetical protein